MFSFGIHIFHANLAFTNLSKCWNMLKNEEIINLVDKKLKLKFEFCYATVALSSLSWN
jgi:hypothetical protein